MKIALVIAFAVVAWFYQASKRLSDPLDEASLGVGHEPRISTVRFHEFSKIDPVSYGSGIAAVKEFSRQYQATFLAGADVQKSVRDMSRSRRRMQREFHALRMWLPNDAPAERRLLAGIEETDAAMALALSEVADRFPEVSLLFGAGILAHPVLRAAGDTW